ASGGYKLSACSTATPGVVVVNVPVNPARADEPAFCSKATVSTVSPGSKAPLALAPPSTSVTPALVTSSGFNGAPINSSLALISRPLLPACRSARFTVQVPLDCSPQWRTDESGQE